MELIAAVTGVRDDVADIIRPGAAAVTMGRGLRRGVGAPLTALAPGCPAGAR